MANSNTFWKCEVKRDCKILWDEPLKEEEENCTIWVHEHERLQCKEKFLWYVCKIKKINADMDFFFFPFGNKIKKCKCLKRLNSIYKIIFKVIHFIGFYLKKTSSY